MNRNPDAPLPPPDYSYGGPPIVSIAHAERGPSPTPAYLRQSAPAAPLAGGPDQSYIGPRISPISVVFGNRNARKSV